LSFDPQLVEAKLALGSIGPEKMPNLAWDALEAGLGGPSIRRLAALVNPSGWEVDQFVPAFMVEAGLKSISLREASVRLARQLASRILSEGLDPLLFTRDFEALWLGGDYPSALAEIGYLHEQKEIAEFTGQTETELREYARSLLLALASSESNPNSGPSL
jgi:hypothetical protein